MKTKNVIYVKGATRHVGVRWGSYPNIGKNLWYVVIAYGFGEFKFGTEI
jgi:hypothetical protein